MSGPTSNANRQKIDEDDHDLLTFGEAGERLRIEINRTAATVERLRETGSIQEVEKAIKRLAALRAAAVRNRAQAINDANFEKFFGYQGKAKRNLPGPGPAG
ncbi:acyl-CoA synthetase [Mycobacterium vicinigordonae]|uniref:Acyl-CoA synthetase n=1 Tax=Mycobacterium vicinigordonae TaxID=1719132 RepID=A0A7D6IPW8_9MYCO|nr:acyl-CoA synthetase [Mycobacterium vicinigordonae]QLL09120.1 acyl-CoA synthetase [Mycobacterium vicinigordonae]